LDVDDIEVVFNYDLPQDSEDYVHRIGRTGRAENPGEAISLICPEDVHHFKIIQKKMGKRVEMMESYDIELRGY